MDIHFLGTGSAYPSKIRDNTSFCITSEDYQVLIDVSGNPCKKLKQLNIDFCQIDAILFTHFHIDHVYGLPSLLWGMWLEGRTKPLTLYCDAYYEEKAKAWLRVMDVDSWGIKFPIEVKTFQASGQGQVENLVKFMEVGELSIACFPAIHSVPTVGFEVKTDDKVVIYSGDTEVNPFIASYENIDILIHEATTASKKTKYHTSVEELVEFYNFDKIEQVKLIHLSDEEDYEGVLGKLADHVSAKMSLTEPMSRLKV